MDQSKYTTLTEALSVIPDPRHARGKRHAWLFLLTLVAAALTSGQKTVNAIADWVRLYADELRDSLKPPQGRMPSGSTFYRTMRTIDLVKLEAQLAGLMEPLASPRLPRRRLRPPRDRCSTVKQLMAKKCAVHSHTVSP